MLAGIQETGMKVWSGNNYEGCYRTGRPNGEKRIETLGFSLETDDACGSLRVRDYERQLEIRSKQMDCENTSPSPHPPHLSLSFSLSLSSFLALSLFTLSLLSFLVCLIFIRARRGLQATWLRRCADFPVSIPNAKRVSSLLTVGRRNLNNDKMIRRIVRWSRNNDRLWFLTSVCPISLLRDRKCFTEEHAKNAIVDEASKIPSYKLKTIG